MRAGPAALQLSFVHVSICKTLAASSPECLLSTYTTVVSSAHALPRQQKQERWAPRFWFSAGKDAVRASGESRRRAPSAHSPSHTNSHLIRSDTMSIPQWVLLSALFIDLAVERWSACGSCVRQHASGCLKPLYSVYFWDEALWCLAALFKKNHLLPGQFFFSGCLLELSPAKQVAEVLNVLAFTYIQNNGKRMLLLTKATLNLGTNFYQKVSQNLQGTGKQFTELSQT